MRAELSDGKHLVPWLRAELSDAKHHSSYGEECQDSSERQLNLDVPEVNEPHAHCAQEKHQQHHCGLP